MISNFACLWRFTGQPKKNFSKRKKENIPSVKSLHLHLTSDALPKLYNLLLNKNSIFQ